jgi:diguanylate cyclase (GGDEF)-like protein
MSRFFIIRGLKIPKTLHISFLENQNTFNLRQLKVLVFLLIGISIVYIIQNRFFPMDGMEAKSINMYLTIFGMIIACSLLYLVLFLSFRKIVSENVKKILLFSFIAVIEASLIFLTFLDLHFSYDISAYIIALMYTCTILWLLPRDFALLSGWTLFLMILSLLILNDSIGIEVYQVVQVFIFYGLSWVMFMSLNFMRTENFMNRATLEEQYTMLETESATDPLTGLYNRRHMKEALLREMARSDRSENPFCIALLDIDHFKTINDIYGHITGDEVLRELAGVLRNSVRLSDKVFRFGGEEFMLILPETKGAEALILGERIRTMIGSFSFSGVRKKITISMGISQSHKGLSLEQIMQRVDKRLYTAKHTGRNKVIWNPDTLGQE